MGKVILEFDSVEEAEDIRDALDGYKWKNAMLELDNYFRNEIKYNNELSEDTYQAYEQSRNKIREILSDNNLIY